MKAVLLTDCFMRGPDCFSFFGVYHTAGVLLLPPIITKISKHLVDANEFGFVT